MSSKEIKHIDGSGLQASGGQTEGMIRKNAVVDLCDKLCSLVMVAKPHSSSAIHHHGEQDTVLYAAKGHGSIVSEGGKKRTEMAPGDFAFIPAFAEHQEVNDTDEEAMWIVVRSGRSPLAENLDGWGSS